MLAIDLAVLALKPWMHLKAIIKIPMLNSIPLTLTVIGSSLIVLVNPAFASPQLRHQVVSIRGNSQNCLARAQSALTRSGFANPATTSDTVSGSMNQLTATIYCQERPPNQAQAIVMIAGTAALSPAMVNSTLSNLTLEISQADSSQPPPVATSGTAISDEAFNQLMNALRSSWPNYLEFLAQPVTQNYFTAAQASQIVNTMRFPNEEVEAAVMLYPRVVDRGNWFVVEQAMSFDRSRRELRQRLTQ